MNIDYSLVFVTDERIEDEKLFYNILQEALEGGVSLVQLREKNTSTHIFYEKALAVKKTCERYKVPLIINDRVDIALAVNADGVHLGQEDMPCAVTRKILGSHRIIGLSVSNDALAQQANTLDVQYIGIGPVFFQKTKPDTASPLGLEGIRRIKQVTTKPLIAIGGITITNAASVVKAGVNGLAIVSEISQASNPLETSKELRNIICKHKTFINL